MNDYAVSNILLEFGANLNKEAKSLISDIDSNTKFTLEQANKRCKLKQSFYTLPSRSKCLEKIMHTRKASLF